MRNASFKMKFAAAPFFGSNIGNAFGEIPAVAVKVLGIVLALAIGLISGFSQDDGAVLSRPLTVTVGIFNANLHDVRIVRRCVSFGDSSRVEVERRRNHRRESYGQKHEADDLQDVARHGDA